MVKNRMIVCECLNYVMDLQRLLKEMLMEAVTKSASVSLMQNNLYFVIDIYYKYVYYVYIIMLCKKNNTIPL